MNAQNAPLQQQAEPEVINTQLGPLTGRPIEQAPKQQPQIRKAASAFRTISEVADELDVQQHVLRFWETKFSQIRPLKRGGGRRYYRPEDVEVVRTIHKLLYGEGYTIKGVQKLFREKGKGQVVEKSLPPAQNSNEAPVAAAVKAAGLSDKQRTALEAVAGELRELKGLLGVAAE